MSGSCDSISSLGLNWHKWRRVSGGWSVTRECGHEKVHALVVSLRTKRRKKKKTEREERRRRKVGLTHACPKTESAGRVKTAAASPIVGNGCACRLSGTLAALHFSTKPRERECVCVCVCVRERGNGRQKVIMSSPERCVPVRVPLRVHEGGKVYPARMSVSMLCTCVCAVFMCRFFFCFLLVRVE